jgi:hypothetical protein
VAVPDAEWKTVPTAERDRIDREHAAEVARAQADHRAALAAVAQIRAMPKARPVTRVAGPAIAPGDEWAAQMHQYESSKTASIEEIEKATTSWERLRLAYYEQRVELAAAQLAVLHCSHQLTRAKAVDRHRLGFDTYDTAVYRGQVAHTQERWYDAETKATAAREDLTRASVRLASAKDTYARIVRNGPNAPTSSYRLADWTERPRVLVGWRERANGTSPHYLTLGARIARR